MLLPDCRPESASTDEEHKPGLRRPPPGDAELREVLQRVQLGGLLLRQSAEPGTTSQAPAASNGPTESRPEPGSSGSTRQHADGKHQGNSNMGLDAVADWAGVLSLGEQQRLAFAR